MEKFLGSQFTVIIFMILGTLLILAIRKIKKGDVSEQTEKNIDGCFLYAGIAIAIFFFLVAECKG